MGVLNAPTAALERLRSIISAWPETREKLSHGAPTWWGGRKTFATFAENHHGDGRVAVWVKSTFEEQELRVQTDPETFFVPPYVGPSGWVGMRLDLDPDWGLVEELLEEGYRLVAPKRALKLLDEG
ncbi:MAG: MmcQ/YjbR family DNA-binding protein [Acidobacteriota bacterium]